MRLQLGEPIYCVRRLAPRERKLIARQLYANHHRIISQQFTDGFLTFRHYGIAMGDGSVIHFAGDNSLMGPQAYIQRTSINQFSKGNNVFLATDVKKNFSNDVIADRASNMLGSNFGGYSIIHNNCEHFANWCSCGRRISRQVSLRQ